MKKLIRDKIPEIMENVNKHCDYYVADLASSQFYAKEKLVEEALEVVQANDDAHLQEELADVLEVIDAICDYYDLDMQSIQAIKKEKADKRGAFKNKYIGTF